MVEEDVQILSCFSWGFKMIRNYLYLSPFKRWTCYNNQLQHNFVVYNLYCTASYFFKQFDVPFPLQSLLKLISDYAVSALNPSRNDSTNESPLKIALFSLAKMCAHPLCRQFIRSSPLFPVIGRLQQSPESSIAKYASVIISKVAEV